jgi:hypothetical protein
MRKKSVEEHDQPCTARTCSLRNAVNLLAAQFRRRGYQSDFKCDVIKFYQNTPNIILDPAAQSLDGPGIESR